MKRKIGSFRQDEARDWVANLECGHSQHVRHKPPWELRPWVIDETARAARVGTELDCLFCDMPELPLGAQVYKSTPVFTEATVPKGLLKDHRTKDQTWARIEVLEGKLRYEIAGEGSWILSPGFEGSVAPGAAHSVAPLGPVRFQVHFLRLP